MAFCLQFHPLSCVFILIVLSAVPADSSCDVCLEPLEPGRCFALSCKHWFCDGCWTGLVNTAVDGGKAAIFSAKCPQDGCSQTVKDFVFQRFLHGDFAGVYLCSQLCARGGCLHCM